MLKAVSVAQTLTRTTTFPPPPPHHLVPLPFRALVFSLPISPPVTIHTTEPLSEPSEPTHPLASSQCVSSSPLFSSLALQRPSLSLYVNPPSPSPQSPIFFWHATPLTPPTTKQRDRPRDGKRDALVAAREPEAAPIRQVDGKRSPGTDAPVAAREPLRQVDGKRSPTNREVDGKRSPGSDALVAAREPLRQVDGKRSPTNREVDGKRSPDALVAAREPLRQVDGKRSPGTDGLVAAREPIRQVDGKRSPGNREVDGKREVRCGLGWAGLSSWTDALTYSIFGLLGARGARLNTQFAA